VDHVAKLLFFSTDAGPNCCFYPGHISVMHSKASFPRDLGYPWTTRPNCYFWAWMSCQTTVFAPTGVGKAGFPGDFGCPRTTWANCCFWAWTPCRTAVFAPNTWAPA
jgi:hypothetical protein